MKTTMLNNQEYSFFEKRELNELICEKMSELKMFHLEKNEHHSPERNHFLYWKKSPAIYHREDEFYLGIELYIDSKDGNDGTITYLVKYNINAHEFEDTFFVLSPDDIKEDKLAEADYHFGLRQLSNSLFYSLEFYELYRETIAILKRELSFEALRIAV